MEAGIFAEISLILAIATAVAGVAHLLKQPLIIGHILTGILVGPAVFNLIKDPQTVELFSHIGVALLLFIIGLGLNPRVVKEVGKVATAMGLGQIIFTSVFGYLIALALGFSSLVALYIGVALTFSSTIIILKLLSDKKELNRLYGKISTGFLLVQDLVAVTILIIISSFLAPTGNATILPTLIRGMGLVGLVWLSAVYLLPKIVPRLARSQEYLFLFSIGWGMGIAALFALTGFSIEVGALLAGVALANSPYIYEISSRMKPLRDFFVILFFIVLGANMNFGALSSALGPAVIFSAYILVGNPLIAMTIMATLGYTRKTSFKAGLTVAQISEFSLILVALGNRVGHLPLEVVSMVTLVGVITIGVSTYLVLYDDTLYKWLEPYLRIFERRQIKPEARDVRYDIILFGYKVGGASFARAFKRMGRPFLVVDYDPEIVDYLDSTGIANEYGDANDPEFLENIPFEKARLVVINLTDFAANALIVDQARQRNPRAVIIGMTKTDDKIEEALELYDRGASYVMMPRYLSSLKVANLLKRYELKASGFEPVKQRHQRQLRAAS